jgi:hypothetical protein
VKQLAMVIELPPPAPPATRAGCVDGPRPCLATGCRHHLAPEVRSGTRRKVSLPLAAMVETCALDVADRGGETLEEVGRILNVTRERIRQIETIALRKMKARGVDLGELAGDEVHAWPESVIA